MNRGKNMELLAPAGDMACALAALDAGADAVYAGLKKFNARERSGNFTFDEFGSLLRYAHERGKKVYTTFNTVLRESEIPEAAEFLAKLDYIRPDGVIVQDLGVVRMIRTYFPRLAIHASTQMGLHNSDDIAIAASLGIRRVILERQTTLEELSSIAKKTFLELEVFVHGALCCCLSGSCLLSSWFGGASGNRGKCKQPCRRLYGNDKGKEGFFLSPGDLAAFPLIPEFRKMGIASLKIEGRLRKPDYVANVVRAYRLGLDASEKDFPEAAKEAQKILARTASRHPTLGFYRKESMEKVIRSGEVGGLGQYCGKVTRVLPGALETVLEGRVHVGDFLRVQGEQGDTGEVFCVLSLKVGGKPCVKALAGTKCVIGTKKEVAAGGLIYRIGETRNDMEGRIGKMAPFKPEEELCVSLSEKAVFVSFPRFPGKKWQEPLSLAQAEKHPLTPGELEEAFGRQGELSFLPRIAKSEVHGKIFLPASLLKSLRRDFRNFCTENMTEELLETPSRQALEKLLADYDAMKGAVVGEAERATERILSGTGRERVAPFFLPEGDLPGEWEKRKEEVEKLGVDTFYIASIGGFLLKKRFPEKELALIPSPPLPLANSFAAAEYLSLGAKEGILHLELGKQDMCLLAEKSPLKLLFCKEGRIVLFATRANLEKTSFLRTGDARKLLVRKEGPLTVLCPEEILRFPEEIPNTIPLRDARRREKGLPEEKSSPFNFYRGLS